MAVRRLASPERNEDRNTGVATADPFQLIFHLVEDYARALQFVRPERARPE